MAEIGKRGPSRPSRAVLNGGGAALQAQAPAARPATQALAQLDELRGRGHFLVQPPMPLAELNMIVPESVFRAGQEQEAAINSKRRNAMETWLQQTAETGFSADLWTVWMAWNPVSFGAKHALRGLFDQLDQQAQLKEAQLRAQAGREGHTERTAHSIRQQLRHAEAVLAAEERKITPLRTRVDQLKAALAKVEAELAEEQVAA